MHGSAVLEARDLSVAVADRTLVRSTSLTVAPGELVALIGPSGAGKTTLLRALAGVSAPTAGRVLLGGEPLWRRSTEVAYVPSADLLHDELTVREELEFAAALRSTSSPAEIAAVVDETIADLRLEGVAESFVATLSTGQRRRVGCGIELVGRPSVMLLDEPAGGLDASLERRLMELLRRLADEGRGVLVTTHATASLAVCDRVAVMGAGGVLRIIGTPDEVLTHFGVRTFAEVYEALTLDEVEALPDLPDVMAAPAEPAPLAPAQPLAYQLRLLTSRYARCRIRERRSLNILIAQAPILGFAIGVVMPRGILSSGTSGPFYSVLFAYLLVVASIWMGFITSCREIVNEKHITARETAVGLRLDAYVLSKCAVLFPIVALQTSVCVAVAAAIQPTQGSLLVLLGLCVLCGWAAATLGLVLSAWATTADQATSTVPLVIIPQLLFAGALFPYHQLAAPLKLVANLMMSRWALTGTGSEMGLRDRLSSDVSQVTGFDGAFFSVSAALPAGVLIVMCILSVAAAGVVLDRELNR